MLRPKPSVLFVHNHATKFVRQDMECLQRRHLVTEYCVRSRLLNPFAVWRLVRTHDVVFGWFASWHTFLPMLFARLQGKPSLLVIGGYDLAKMPAIGYGHQRGGLKKWLSRWTMRCARCLVTNSHYSQLEATRNAGISKGRVTVVYHGVPDFHGSLPPGPREPMVLTVGNVDRPNLWRKGLEPFVRAAALMPGTQFVLVGEWQDDAIRLLRSIATPNVKFAGRVDEAALLDYYRRSSVYVQVSRHEGFGMSVAEAMLAGCIPVVTECGALPEVAGDCGVYCASQHPMRVAEAVQEALNLSDDAHEHPRSRIIKHFPPEQRREHLEELLECILAGNPPRLAYRREPAENMVGR